jgi:hypothetical protein
MTTTRIIGALFGAQRAPALRSLLLLLALAAATLLLARIVDPHYPIAEWLFFRYALAWLYTALFCTASLAIGNVVVSALSLPGERLDGHVTLSFATGVLVFGLCMFAVGFAGGLGPAAFVAVPAALIALGAPRARRDLTRLAVRMRGRRWLAPLSAAEAIGFAAGAVALIVIYVPTLVPDNAAYDTRWYHLGLAEHYVAAGAIARLPEGPMTGAIPHLATALYTWALLVPGGDLFDRVELAAHLELAIFVFTLPGLCVLFRHLVPDQKGRLAWLALFLFPAIFVYDATLTTAADHVAALFAVPAYICLVRALRELRPLACALLAIQLAGLMLSKYTAVIAAAFPVLAVVARAAWLSCGGIAPALRGGAMSMSGTAPAFRGGAAAQRTRGRVPGGVLGLCAALGVGLALTTPHWLKNWIWYGDPMYPLLHRHLSPRPWNEDSPFFLAAFQSTAWQAQGTAQEKIDGTLRALHDHSYELYNWVDFHGRYPIFGSLFTLGLLALPLLDRTRRIWQLVLATHLGIAIWFLLFHYDRYLQTLLPWMAACVAAILALCWRAGWPARAGAIALLSLQLVWGLDMPLWPLHRGSHNSGIGTANAFFARAYSGDRAGRTRPFDDYAGIGRSLPARAKVLLHHEHTRLGIGAMTVTDAPTAQHGINYVRLGSSRALHRRLRQFGVTHVVWQPRIIYGDETAGGDLVFHTYVTRHLVRPQVHGMRMVAELPASEPGDDGHTVFYFGCSNLYQNGLYELRDLSVSPLEVPGLPPKVYPPPRVALLGDAAALASGASHAIVNRACAGAPNLEGFELLARQNAVDYLLRRPAP